MICVNGRFVISPRWSSVCPLSPLTVLLLLSNIKLLDSGLVGVLQSINHGAKLDEERFLVKGDLTTGQTDACRQALALPQGIIDGLPYIVEVCSKCSDPERTQTPPLAQILQAGGAIKAKRRETIHALSARRTLIIHCEHRESSTTSLLSLIHI